MSSEVSHTPPADDSDEMEFIIIRDEFSDTDDASEENEEERKRIAEEKLQESLRAAQERRRQAEARVDETEPEDEVCSKAVMNPVLTMVVDVSL